MTRIWGNEDKEDYRARGALMITMMRKKKSKNAIKTRMMMCIPCAC